MGDTSVSQLGDIAYKLLFLLAATNDSLGAGDMRVMPPQLLAAAVQLALQDDSLNRRSADIHYLHMVRQIEILPSVLLALKALVAHHLLVEAF
jgi:hypothetical protein